MEGVTVITGSVNCNAPIHIEASPGCFPFCISLSLSLLFSLHCPAH